MSITSTDESPENNRKSFLFQMRNVIFSKKLNGGDNMRRKEIRERLDAINFGNELGLIIKNSFRI